jgi:hypothetical protein
MSSRVELVILCEDRQQESFVREFARAVHGRTLRHVRVLVQPRGEGSGEQWVRERLPREVRAVRGAASATALVAITDTDSRERLRQLQHHCESQGIAWPRPGERVLVLLPCRNIETWLAYLAGETVAEERPSPYPRLARQSQCRPHVAELARMCRDGALREPAPDSLRQACVGYGAFVCALGA